MALVSIVLAGLLLGPGEVPDPRPRGHVSAPAALVPADAASRLDAESAALLRDLGVEVLLVARATCPEASTAAALRDRWRVGEAHADKALVILACAAERRVELATGAGLAGRLPVGWLDAIEREHLLPLALRRDVAGALEVALTLVERKLRQEQATDDDDGPPQVVAVRPRLEVSLLDVALGVVLGAGPVLFALMAIRSALRRHRAR